MTMKKLLPAIAISLSLMSCHKENIINEVHVDTTVVNQVDYHTQFIIAEQQPVTQSISPIHLRQGDKVAVCAASNAVSEAEINEGIRTLESWGLSVIKADNLTESDGRYPGTLDQRVKGMQAIVDNQEIRAIFMARGGYGSAQILPYIDWKPMTESPKWLIGYSDVTALHIALNNMGFQSIHGPMMVGFCKDSESISRLKDILMGTGPSSLEIPANANCIAGQASGRLVGGNLSLIYAMNGTAFDLNTMDAILFIEDTGEANYSVDRMMLSLKQSGKLDQIKGLIVGDIIGGSQGMDLPVYEIIHKYVGDLGIPVVYGIPAGHSTKNMPLILGSKVKISVDSQKASITFENNAALAK